ncbi:hypothetical protein NDN08_008082 [Rhodosorus marinus]|uniref:NAD(+) diphosphatase n=1 Tax=Rhodosorus marinus TaxID=101924 RepID=A0AAV8V270_9RHOD|nr:hypothetical protein NDN08_008082 [Rhodosorus marinus]
MMAFVNELGVARSRRLVKAACSAQRVFFSVPEMDRSFDGNSPAEGKEVYVPVVDGNLNLIKTGAGATQRRMPVMLDRGQVERFNGISKLEIAKLGDLDGTRYFAVDLPDRELFGSVLDGAEAVSRIPLIVQDMDEKQVAVLSYARGLMWFHRNTRFCTACGSTMNSVNEGRSRACEGCEKTVYPRIDPAVITLVANGNECLLGRKASWPRGRYSLLAGFTEVGETLEDTVYREVKEESGVDIDRNSVKYHSSQPWPFPRSLMIGFSVNALSTKIKRDENELEDVRWFDKEFIRARLRTGGNEEFNIPPKYALANRMISEWIAE